MKIKNSIFYCTQLLFSLTLFGQGFDTGSDGSYGPLNITEDTTLDLPEDGIFHCTTINVASGKTLQFNRNALNTPVYLLATEDVTIAGTINVSSKQPPNVVSGGLGGPGGFDGGPSGYISSGVTVPGGDGMGPGGGKRGSSETVGGGGFGSTNSASGTRGHGDTYGNPLLIPLVGGSGGGGVDGSSSGSGGGGGGAILIASPTTINLISPGLIISQSITGLQTNGGSAGAVRLVAPEVFGNGVINVSGWWSLGAVGRIRIDSLFKVDPTDHSRFIAISFNPSEAATVGANMMVFPPNNPRLDIVEAAGSSISEGTSGPVVVVLPIDAPPNQTVRVQARNFGDSVPIRVALIPDSGGTTYFDATIENSTDNPATTDVAVVMPTNVKVNLQVWTR